MTNAHHISLHTLFMLSCAMPASAQWQPVGEMGSNYAIAVHGDLLFAGMQGDSIYVSPDQGDTWSAANTGITSTSNWWLSSVDGTVYCGTQWGPAFRSTDDGANWEDIGLNGVRGFEEHNDTLYACQWYGPSVHWSVDEGDTWNATAALTGSGGLWPMISYHGYLFVGGQGGGVFRIRYSTDTWTPVNNGLGNLNAYTFTAMGDRLFVGTTAGVWYSDDDGANWQVSGMTGGVVYGVHAVGSHLFAGGDVAISVSTDSGGTWTAFNDGLNSSLIGRITSDVDYLYAGAYSGGGVHRRAWSEITGVEEGASMTSARPVVFPVPAQERVQLQWPGHLGLRYRVRDLAGALVDQGPVRDGSIDLSRLQAGTYLLEVEDRKNENAVLRLLKD